MGKHLRVMSCIPDALMADALTPPIPIPSGHRVHLRVEVAGTFGGAVFGG
jgi:xylan 1,4-beta-xylosidase